MFLGGQCLHRKDKGQGRRGDIELGTRIGEREMGLTRGP